MDYYFYNTDADSLVGPPRPRFHILVEQRFAATGGPQRYGELLGKLKEGDILLMYENGVGIIAVGRVCERWDGKSHEDLVYYQPSDKWTQGPVREYRIAVDWTRSDNPISVQEVGRRFGYTPRPTIQPIRKQRAEAEAIVAAIRLATVVIHEAIDLRAPDRVTTTTSRIVRDTELACQIKALHRYECQVCGHTINLPDGSRYAEAHHIQPLGAPHHGLDVGGNIVCVCPNHHAELDLGAITINLAALRHREGHSIEHKYVQYHNCKVYRGSGADT